ncbi:hypothetical protein [Paenibacillus lautus]|nr:hypothetical protein [Paenibacillus lautus]MEC0260203.1 hypothetical protein [Paenibacillus lautus]
MGRGKTQLAALIAQQQNVYKGWGADYVIFPQDYPAYESMKH